MLFHLRIWDLAGQVDVVSILESLRVCTRLKRVTLNQDSDRSQQQRRSSKGIPLSVPDESPAVNLPTLQVLEIPMRPGFLDLQACAQLHSLHITDAFELEGASMQSRSLASIIEDLRSLSKKFKMPDGGQWSCPRAYSRDASAHWHRPSSSGRCYSCLAARAIHLGPSIS
jgi:hypothetical protein